MSGRIDYSKLPTTGAESPAAPVKRQLSEVGRVSIGYKKQTERGKEYPTSVDHFIIRSQFASRVTGLYGAEPKELPVMFYSDDFNEVCYERLEIRDTAGKLFGYGDGKAFKIFNPKSGTYVDMTTDERPDIMNATAGFLKTEWAPVLTIRFVIRDIPILGYWQFSTKAVKTTIPNLRDTFDQCLQQFGTVRFFPFILTVKKVKSNKPGDTRQYPIVDIMPQMSLETGLKLAEYIEQNPDFNQAKLALMTADQLNQNTAGSRLQIGGEKL